MADEVADVVQHPPADLGHRRGQGRAGVEVDAPPGVGREGPEGRVGDGFAGALVQVRLDEDRLECEQRSGQVRRPGGRPQPGLPEAGQRLLSVVGSGRRGTLRVRVESFFLLILHLEDVQNKI